MKLVENWQAVVKRAWSMWLIAVATLLQVLEIIVPEYDDVLPKWSVIAVLVAAFFARLIKQKSVSGDK